MINQKIAPSLRILLLLRAEFSNILEESQRSNIWEVIVKCSGNIKQYEQEYDFVGEYLIGEFAIIRVKPEKLERVAEIPEVIYMELPSRVWYGLEQSKIDACIYEKAASGSLTGNGVMIGIIDSGIDLELMDFRREDGTSRVLALWDQTANPIEAKMTFGEIFSDEMLLEPPEGYLQGVLYTKDMIDIWLKKREEENYNRLLSVDSSGHGTHVAEIACGNGGGSGKRYVGVAPQADILVVKMGDGSVAPSTTRLMEAVNYIVMYCEQRKKPVAINMSFGNNTGAHTGSDLVSAYIDQASQKWKSSFCAGMGNEGISGRHKRIELNEEEELCSFILGSEREIVSMSFWVNFEDEFDMYLIEPNGKQNIVEQERGGFQRIEGETYVVFAIVAEPSPYEILQEILFMWFPKAGGIREGVWKLRFLPRKIRVGRVDGWIQQGAALQGQTRFLQASVDTTLTMPAFADRVISVGAYNNRRGEVVAFSGRGYTRNEQIKPDLVAPGVNILANTSGNIVLARTGTSMSTPFVTGCACLLLEWGIIKGNDIFLYGQKLKAYLRKGARSLEENKVNELSGFGSLCLEETLRLLS